jgi:hypothetical protein
MPDKCETCGKPTNYNGWPNYETWAVKLWIDNDQGSYIYWHEQAAAQHRQEAPATEQVTRGTWTAKECARFNLEDQLKEELEEEMPEVSGMWADLLNSAFGEVNWQEIARAFLAEE